MPNRKELVSLVDHAMPRPAFSDGHPFINALSRSYWSSSTSAYYGSGNVWALNFIPGWWKTRNPGYGQLVESMIDAQQGDNADIEKPV